MTTPTTPQKVTRTCEDFEKHQWCPHMPQGALKTRWDATPQESIKMSKTSNDDSFLFEWDLDVFPGKTIQFVQTKDGRLGYIESDISSERTRLLGEVKTIVTLAIGKNHQNYKELLKALSQLEGEQ